MIKAPWNWKGRPQTGSSHPHIKRNTLDTSSTFIYPILLWFPVYCNIQYISPCFFWIFYLMESTFISIEHLVLQSSKEIFYQWIVQTVTFVWHGLYDYFFLKDLMISSHLILPPLIGMQDQSSKICILFKSLIQHLYRLWKIRTAGNTIGDDLPIV